jgi:hypothetical protein
MGWMNLIGGGGVVVWAGALPVLVGGAELLGQARGGGGGGGRDVRDVGALAAEVAGEEDERDGPAEDRGEEGHGERGRELRRRRRHLVWWFCFSCRRRQSVQLDRLPSFLPCCFSTRGECGCRVYWAGLASRFGPSTPAYTSKKQSTKFIV